MNKTPIISLLTDFGVKDAYVGCMKGVVLSICPYARIIDITHEIPKFNIRYGAFVLMQTVPYFPEGTIHIAVVDPGVGTKRRPIIIETNRCYYVGPDNGLLILSSKREGIRHVYNITNQQFMLPKISKTFHGRDIFSCVAAHIATGIYPSEFGPEICDYVSIKFTKPWKNGKTLYGEIIHIDSFGNIVTNISLEDLEKEGISKGRYFFMKLRDKILKLKLCSTYSEVPIQSPLTIIGSSNFLEVSVNQGNASKTFNTKIGDLIIISLELDSVGFR